VTVKQVVPRRQANTDVDDVIAHYLSGAGERAAIGFVDASEVGYAHISRHPSTGSTRYAHELNLPGLRFWPVSRYPYLIFFVERAHHIDVWRVLHSQRDIPASMQTVAPAD
jgi:toxin ParE1/3/4